jgi:hypothetical protein
MLDPRAADQRLVLDAPHVVTEKLKSSSLTVIT